MRKIPFTSAVRYRTCGKVQKNEIFFSPYLTEEQTISKWELGKSVPDEASLILLYQCLDINHKEGKIIKKMAVSKQTNNILDYFSSCIFPGSNRNSLLFAKSGKK